MMLHKKVTFKVVVNMREDEMIEEDNFDDEQQDNIEQQRNEQNYSQPQPRYTPRYPKLDINRWLMKIDYFLKKTGLDRDEFVMDMVESVLAAEYSPSFRRNMMEAIDREIQRALVNHDPFVPYPKAHNLKTDGILLGTHLQTGLEIWWSYEEQEYSMLVLGSVGGGKTNEILWILERLTQ